MNVFHLALLALLQFSFTNDQVSKFSKLSILPDSVQQRKIVNTIAANIILKSTDGGQTWQDISEGLPANVQADGFVGNGDELYIHAGNGLYHGKSNSKAPFWKKESLPEQRGNIAAGKTGVFIYNYNGQFLENKNGAGLWLPVYLNFPEKEIFTVYETGTATLIGTRNSLFKSTEGGKAWERVYSGGWVMKLVQTNGVMLATSQKGIIRSTDDGNTWDSVINEGGVGIDVETIKGGFAAISYNTKSETRIVRLSYDGGINWQPVDAGLPSSLSITSIIEVGEYFFCGHPNGIYRSSDKGKTWQLLLPSVDDKVFNLSVSNGAIYAIPKEGGC